MTKIAKNDFETLRQIIDEGTKEYYAWLRHILTLSMGSLTLLIALRNQFLLAAPQAILLLKLSWLLFAASIILALFALAGYHRLLFRTASEYRKSLESDPDTSLVGRTDTPKVYRQLGRIVPWVFVAAVLSLTLFGILGMNPADSTKPAISDKPVTTSVYPNNK